MLKNWVVGEFCLIMCAVAFCQNKNVPANIDKLEHSSVTFAVRPYLARLGDKKDKLFLGKQWVSVRGLSTVPAEGERTERLKRPAHRKYVHVYH